MVASRLLAAALAVALALLVAAPVALAGHGNSISQFSAGVSPGAGPEAIVSGPEGDLWFTEREGGRIGRITPAGVVSEFSAGITPGSGPSGIALGAEGDLWFTEREGSRIGRITPAGEVTEFSAGLTAASAPTAITLGHEGDLWFTEVEGDRIGRITPAGAVTEFSAGITAGSEPLGITTGAEGNLWFTEREADQVARITPAGEVTEFPGLKHGSGPSGITAGPEGDLWFTEEDDKRIGRITTAGEVTEFGQGVTGRPADITTGPDGNLWFTEGSSDRLGRITPAGEVKKFAAGIGAGSTPHGIAAGSDGNLWFTESGGDEIGRILSGAPPASVSSPVLSSASVGRAELCGGAVWSSWVSLQPSASMFSFDGYRWLLNGLPVASGPLFTPSAALTGQKLSCSETVTYPLLDVTASASSLPIAVTVPKAFTPVGCTLCRIPHLTLTLGAVGQSASTWREGGKLAHLSAKPKLPPLGTTFSFSLNEPAKVTFTFAAREGGREVAGRCVAQTRKNAHRRACRRTVKAGVISLAGHNGLNKVSFQGRLSRSRWLAPRHYTLTLLGTNTAGVRSQVRTLAFTIVK